MNQNPRALSWPTFLFWCLLAFAAQSICAWALALTGPGTAIDNRAQLNYIDAASGRQRTVVSNAARILVGKYYSHSLQQNTSVAALAGDTLHFAHSLKNTGNAPDQYLLEHFAGAADSGTDVPLRDVEIVEDANGNGFADPSERTLARSAVLAAGESLDIVLRADVPHSVQPGAVLSVVLTATSVAQERNTRSVTDRAQVEAGPQIVISKETGPQCDALLLSGDEVRHTISVVNNGTAAPIGVRQLRDGQLGRAVVVQQDIAHFFRFTNFTAVDANGTGAVAVLRLEGVAENSWISASNWNGGGRIVSAGLWFEPGQLAPGASAAFSIAQRVADTGDTTFYTNSAYARLGGGLAADVASNNTCNRFSSPAAARSVSLRFVEVDHDTVAPGARADFYDDRHFTDAVQYRLGFAGDTFVPSRDGIFLELDVAAVTPQSTLLDADGKRYVIVSVGSEASGDTVNVVLLQTDEAGVYRSVAPIRLATDRRSNGGHCPRLPDADDILIPEIDSAYDSCVLGSHSDDRLQGRFVDITGLAVADSAIVDPQALVFNSQTRLPVAGALVSVRLAQTDEVAIDRFTGQPLQFTTGADGRYTMPVLQPNIDYYLRVDPPPSHVFPSSVPASQLAGFDVRAQSYGRAGFGADLGAGSGIFRIASGELVDPVDIPLDSDVAERRLMVEKIALQREVEPGQTVSYRIELRNTDEANLRMVELRDTPPFGFRYIDGSATIDDVALDEAPLSQRGQLQFDIGELEAGAQVVLRYVLRAGAGALDSDGVNSAVATGVTQDNAQIVSNVARASVRVRREGVLSDRAALFGKLYVDQDCNGRHNDGEWPIGGVRLYLQDGTFVITDADGMYSLYGLAPGSHVIAVDDYTLPHGLQLKLLDSHQGVDPRSRFVDLAAGDFYRADFAARCPDDDVDSVFAEIRARNSSIDGAWLLRSAERYQLEDQTLQRNVQGDANKIDGDLSHGVIDGPAQHDGSVTVARARHRRAAADEPAEPIMPDPKKRVASITAKQASSGTWLWPLQSLSVDGRFVAVVREGVDPTLYVNGEAVSAAQIGERLINRRERAQIVAWYGVELQPGDNRLVVSGTGPFGNRRVLAEGVFKRPSTATQIRISATEPSIAADGGLSSLPVRVELLDDNDLPALGVYFITIDSSDGGWLEDDIQDSEPGRQIRVANGARTIHYLSSEQTGPVTLRASTASFDDEVTIRQVAQSRPLIAVGFAEIGASINERQRGGFARQLEHIGRGRDVDARTAFFLKGRVKDKYNLTLSYDSDKDSDAMLLRDINPADYYPIHGDASIRGYEGQSRSKLFVKLEEDANSVMWGDYLTDADGEQRNLAISRRTLTGFNSVIGSGKNRFRGFAAYQRDPRIEEEFAGNGSAMLYRLGTYPIVANSEVVEIITRSRENPGLITGRTRLTRFGDYTIDPIDGYVSFSRVVPTLDDRQDPVFVRISYDVEDGGRGYLVSGFRLDRTASDKLKFGVSYTRDENSELGAQIAGGYASYITASGTELFASIAASDSVANGRGSAYRFSAQHKWRSGAKTVFTHARTDRDFNNFSASAAPGRTETRVNHKHGIGERANLLVDVVQSDSSTTGESRNTLSAQIESRWRQWMARFGLRRIARKDAAASENFITTVLGADRKFLLGGRPGSVRAEYEQDTSRSSRRRVAFGTALQVHDSVKLYGNYELANSLLGLAGFNFDQRSEALTVGVESSALASTRLYTEYRMRGAFDGRDYATAVGLRGDYELRENLRVNPSLEVIQSADGSGESIAASVAVTDTRNPNSRKLARLEARQSDSSDYVGLRASVAARVSEGWSLVLSERLTNQRDSGRDSVLRHSLVAGLSKRPKTDNRHHMLLLYNWREERGIDERSDRTVHLLSTHQNLQLSDGLLLSGRLGGKRQVSQLDQRRYADFSMLADLRLNVDLTRRFNVDVRGGVLATNGGAELRLSAGAGAHYIINRNTRIAFSYNFGGFRDEDLDWQEYNLHGFRVGLQFKFDEDLFEWLQ